MSAARIAFALVAALALAACNQDKEPTYQGWIEAELIFVGPDEMGRIETLYVREGDKVEVRQPLFTVDADLQLADVAMQEASVKNAQQAYDRAAQLLKTNTGTQKALDDAEAALRTAQARLNSAQTRLTRRKMFSPVAGSVQQIYYREVIARVLPVLRARLTLAVERGELPNDALARFPQLLVAPGLMAIIWDSLFERFEHLDVRALMRAHLGVLFGERSAT